MDSKKKEGVSRSTFTILLVIAGLMAVMAGATVYMVVQLNKPVEIASRLETIEEAVWEAPARVADEKPGAEYGDTSGENGLAHENSASLGVVEKPEVYSDISPLEWGALADAGQHIVVVASIYCEPCKRFKDEVLPLLRKNSPDIPYYIFEVGENYGYMEWLLQQDLAAIIMDAINMDGLPTPTILFMEGHNMVWFHAGILDYDRLVSLAEEVF